MLVGCLASFSAMSFLVDIFGHVHLVFFAVF